MDRTEERAARYDRAILSLPAELRACARRLEMSARADAEELRLRAGRVGTVLLPEGERPFTDRILTPRDLDGVLELATQASVHTAREAFRAGYITVRGGFRIGIGGTAVIRDGQPDGFRAVSSLALRISREVRGAGEEVIRELTGEGAFRSTLLLSPPGVGKTTLLRDLVRLLSDGDPKSGLSPQRVSLADERGEVAALQDGVPRMDVGRQTDVLENCPKDRAVLQLLRTMNPQIVALDEVTAPEDVQAIRYAANCGVQILATAHADGLSDLLARPLYRELLRLGVFRHAVLIQKNGRTRTYKVIRLEETI